MTRRGRLAAAAATLLLLVCAPSTAGGARSAAAGARSARVVECQQPLITGVEIYRMRRISIARACSVALAFFRWEINGRHRLVLYRCHERGQRHPRPHLRLRHFRGWHLSLRPQFVMSRHGASFALAGNGFPLDCHRGEP